MVSVLALGPMSSMAEIELASRIELPGTEGRLDHLSIDIDHSRLFVAALGADAVEVIDLKAGKRMGRLEGRHEPQGLAYEPATQGLIVANGSGGNVEAFRADKRVGAAGELPDADNLRLDARSNRVYVGYGKALAVLDPVTMSVLERIALPGHPEAFELATQGPQIYVNVPSAGALVVVDRRTGKTTATWDVAPASRNFPMALDESSHRLFVGTRQPGALLVFNTATGKKIAELRLCGDADDLFFDAQRRDLYAICGEGQVAVVRQRDADHYEVTRRIPTSPGARTGLLVPALNSLYVAAPSRERRPAQVLVYRIE